jgi:osmotically inducible lipoprotein OsmB
MIKSKSGVALALVASFSLLTAAGCTQREKNNMLVGGALGAGTGAVVGAATGGSVLGGAAVGGAVGAGTGYILAQ